jgi:hypothetical protein
MMMMMMMMIMITMMVMMMMMMTMVVMMMMMMMIVMVMVVMIMTMMTMMTAGGEGAPVLGPGVLCGAGGGVRRDGRDELQPSGQVEAAPPDLRQRRTGVRLEASQHGAWAGLKGPFETCLASCERSLSCLLRQLVCPGWFDSKFLLLDVRRFDYNDFPLNVGLAVAVTYDSCPALLEDQLSCLFVDASSITSDIGGYIASQYWLSVGFVTSKPDTVHVFLVDESLAGLCQLSGKDSWERGFFSFSPSSARDVWDHHSYEETPVALQLTRRRELRRGWGWGWTNRPPTQDVNSYRAEVRPQGFDKGRMILDDPALAYPVLAPGDVSSVRASWSDEDYRIRTVTPLMDEFWRDNGTNSYYFNLAVSQFSEVVTYTQHDPVDPVALLGIYGT